MIERFLRYVNKEGPNGCWIWLGSRTARFGYGNFRVNSNRSEVAHRVSWRLHRGEIPDGLCVLHKCDNPPCVNPDHLFLGTKRDNNLDRHSKDRDGAASGLQNGAHTHPESRHFGVKNARHTHPETTARGERVHTARLTEDAVRTIRQAVADGHPMRQFAAQYGVDPSTIERVIRRQTWKHLP